MKSERKGLLRVCGWLLGISCLSWMLISCGPTQPEGKQWSTMTYNDKLEFMALEIFDPMKKLLQDFDADRFKDFGCKTCHGANHDAIKYKMPNGITAIDLANLGQEKQEYVKFMTETFMPEFKKLMEKVGHTTTSCATCHPSK